MAAIQIKNTTLWANIITSAAASVIKVIVTIAAFLPAKSENHDVKRRPLALAMPVSITPNDAMFSVSPRSTPKDINNGLSIKYAGSRKNMDKVSR
ncbi:hypothetical protein SDC9_208629 [bioreactor metagenome]|uniref:Uncharacterized protein n=1 Tax=bioreactor metagenome TaxID=1076179 RepID=A0A645JBS0_9ZZZZ